MYSKWATTTKQKNTRKNVSYLDVYCKFPFYLITKKICLQKLTSFETMTIFSSDLITCPVTATIVFLNKYGSMRLVPNPPSTNSDQPKQDVVRLVTGSRASTSRK